MISIINMCFMCKSAGNIPHDILTTLRKCPKRLASISAILKLPCVRIQSFWTLFKSSLYITARL